MKATEYIARTEEAVFHTYNRFPVVFESGDGVYLKDTDGKEYLDFGAGIAVFALGYGNEYYKNALKRQVDKLIHTSNLFYNIPLMEAAEKLREKSGMDKVFFTNSGTEAVEGAIKAARKYSMLKYGPDRYEIISMEHSFHGRSTGALAVTGNAHYREPFGPLMEGILFADYNDIESVKALVSEKTCAIILETVQGEGGIYPADPAFLSEVKKICESNDILLILDEIQCGMGRCGSYFAWQKYAAAPDIMTTAKALGCGVPVGAFVLNEKVAGASMVPGDHGTTYGGNPLACAAVSAVFDQFAELDLIGHVNEITPYFEEKLDQLTEKYDFLKERRGMGLMQGIEVKEGTAAGKIAAEALKAGLVILTAGSNVLRFVPPLVIEKTDIDEMIKRLETVLDTL